MQCPVCRVDLMIADRQGIEIDYCPKCRGVWLDRGELDKIIERSAMAPPPHYEREYREPQQVFHAPPAHHAEHHGRPYGHHKHKRKSFLEEMFDFD